MRSHRSPIFAARPPIGRGWWRTCLVSFWRVGMTLTELNDAEPETARPILSECCGSVRWVEAMLLARPLSSEDELYKAADTLWWSLTSADWLEAFSKHPKIGERKGLSVWSSEEQRGM